MTREEYVEQLLKEDDVLSAVRDSILSHEMPPISVAPELGRLLTLFVQMSNAKQVLEIGALGGYSGICLARGLPPSGRLISLELKPEFAEVAQLNMERAGLAGQVEYRIGNALDCLERCDKEGLKFDVIFIDADKPNYPNYLEWAVRLANSGAIIIADNVLIGDRVLDPNNHDPSPEAIRIFNERMHTDPRLDSVLLPMRDGFAIARVK